MKPDEVTITATPAPRTARHLARHFVRSVKRAARSKRTASLPPIEAGSARLVPVDPSHAEAWFALTELAGRPGTVGLGASPLGGMARTPQQWQATARQLRRAHTPAYLVMTDGSVIGSPGRDLAAVGEVLTYFDPATAVVELVVWLAPAASAVADDVLAALARELLGGDVRRVLLAVTADDALAAAAMRQGFTREGVHADPPFTARHIFVRHHREP